MFLLVWVDNCFLFLSTTLSILLLFCSFNYLFASYHNFNIISRVGCRSQHILNNFKIFVYVVFPIIFLWLKSECSIKTDSVHFIEPDNMFLVHVCRVRMHYGHPDVFDRIFHITRGGISKASRGINLSEDIFAGSLNFEYFKFSARRLLSRVSVYHILFNILQFFSVKLYLSLRSYSSHNCIIPIVFDST